MAVGYRWVQTGLQLHLGYWDEFFRVKEVGERIRLRGFKDWRFIKNHARSGEAGMFTFTFCGKEQKVRVYGLGAEEALSSPSATTTRLRLLPDK